MAFFDLNIPYTGPSPPGRSSSRAKLVTKALELGYAGVAYNRTIQGVMSDHDRCSIPLLTLPSLLKHCPQLLSAVHFHRDLLGLPRATPFRQYTRLTVCVESQAQAQALNSGNPVLKTYDLVAIKPLSQSAFDLACEKLEVDIIAIDFSEKVHFRLKMPMVKAAIKRGVYFEITYANLIADVKARKQIITNAKLLVDWTRGRNIIVSSASPTANEFRGPYDVANLMSLLGLSMERAKAAVSRNCRTLISNAVRKKRFFKEAIKVEVLPSGQETDKKKPWSSDSFKWDPISSGDGDLLLEDLVKSFATSRKNKAIDFSSVLDSKPSLGFQVNDVLPTTELFVSQSVASDEKVVSVSEAIEQSVVTSEVPEQPERLYVPQSGQAPACDGLFEQQMFRCENTQKSYSACALIDAVEIKAPTLTSEAELKNVDGTNENFDLITTKIHDFHSQKCVTNRELNVVPANDNLTFPPLDPGSEAACTASSEVEVSTNTDIPSPQIEDMCANGSDTRRHLVDEIQTAVDVENREEKYLLLNSSSVKISETKQVRESGDDAVILANVPVRESNDINTIDDCSDVTQGPTKVIIDKKGHGKAGTERNYPGKSRRKRKTSHQMNLFPLKRLLHPIPVKKARKS